MKQAQRRLMLEAMSRCGLTPGQVWLHYCGNGGRASEAHLALFLQGAESLTELERDILAHAINEMLWDRRHESMVPYATTPAAQALEGPRISAAAAWLLTDTEAEDERLRSLSSTGLMHSGPATVLDELVSDARAAFDVSSATVSLIDADSQYLKAARGPLPRHAPRREAFCDEAIRTAATFVISDTRRDPRFANHPLVVQEPYLRFYAAHPLRGPGGWNIGAFCILDQRPHAFPAAERLTFRRFARRAQQEISRSRHTEETRHRSAERN